MTKKLITGTHPEVFNDSNNQVSKTGHENPPDRRKFSIHNVLQEVSPNISLFRTLCTVFSFCMTKTTYKSGKLPSIDCTLSHVQLL